MSRAPEAVARAHSNIALAKYWGKRRPAGAADGNVPAVPSLSAGLADLWVEARVGFTGEVGDDRVVIGGAPAGPVEADRVGRLMGWIRQRAGARLGWARVETTANFPMAAGLASSAAAFAALAAAGSDAAGLGLSLGELSVLARRASGSAARSVFGGYVELPVDDDDPAARPLRPASYWPLEVAVVLCQTGAKATGSREGMRLARETSPYWSAWLATARQDFAEIRAALLARDAERLADRVEQNCLAMHATALTARPPILYWAPATLGVMGAVIGLRRRGKLAFFTIDAGANPVIFLEAAARPDVEALLGELELSALWTCVGGGLTRPGGGAA